MNQLLGIKGAPRIVYEELERMLDEGHAVSLDALSERTFYHPVTVSRALTQLQEWGLVKVHQSRPGCRANYEVLCYSN
jgi:predicted transcriptional regulator